jgi:hypothetical protein
MSPRDKFRSNRTLTRGYNDTISGFQMQSALDTAMMEQDLSMPVANDSTTAAANAWRKEGAQKFRQILENLNSDRPTPTPHNAGQLNHNL